jgi:membrane protein
VRGAKIGQALRAAAPVVLQAAPWIAMAAMALFWRRRSQPTAGLSIEGVAPAQSFAIAEPNRGRTADAPRQIPARGWKDVAWRTYREIAADRLPAVAGGVTFYALLAFFPAIGVFVSLYGLFSDVAAVREQLAQFGAFFPPQVLSIVGDQMIRLATRAHASLSVAFVVSLLLSVWSANAGMKSLFDGLNIAYDETERRSYLKQVALTYAFTLAVIVFVTLMGALLVATPMALQAMGLDPESWVWAPLRWLGLFALAAGAFSAVYRFGPSRAHPRWRWVVIGGVTGAFLWLAGSLGFSWYFDHVAHLDATYGPLGAVMAFMLWIWFSVLTMLVGAELNAEIEHQTARDSTTGEPLPMGLRGAAMADTVGLAFKFDIADLFRKGGVGRLARSALTRAHRKRQPNSSSSAASRPA